MSSSAAATPSTTTRRIFARQYAPEAFAGMEHRRENNLRRIEALRSSLSGMVSSPRSSSVAAAAGYYNMDYRRGSGVSTRTETLESPSPANDLQHQLLLVAHSEVERLTCEKHALEIACVRQEEHLNGLLAIKERGDGEVGMVSSPRDPDVTQAGTPPPQPQTSASSHVIYKAICSLFRRIGICYPELLEGLAVTKTCDGTSLHNNEEMDEMTGTALAAYGGDNTDAALNEEGVAEAFRRLERVIPGLVSSSRLGDLFTEAGSELLNCINTLEDEKQSDYFRVVSITERLTAANTALQTELGDRERHIELLKGNESQLRATLENIMEEKGKSQDLLRAERGSRQAEGEQYLQCIRDLEKDIEVLKAKGVKPLASSTDCATATDGDNQKDLEESVKELREQLDNVDHTRETERQTHTTQMDEMAAALETQKQDNASLAERLAAAEAEMDALRAQAEQSSLQNEQANINNSIAEAEEVAQYRSDNELLRAQLKDALAAQQQHKEENSRHQEDTEVIQNLEAQLRDAQEALSQSEEKHAAVSSELSALKQTAADTDESHRRELEVYRVQLDEKEQEIAEQASAINLAMAQLEKLTSSDNQNVEALQSEKETSQARESELLRNIESLEARCSDYANDAQRMQEEIESLKANNNSITEVKDVSSIALHDEEGGEELQRLRELCATLKEENASLAARMQDTSGVLSASPSVDQSMNIDEDPINSSSTTDDPAVELRKARQSLKRLTLERTATRKKLDSRTSALTEAEEQLEAATRDIAILQAQLQAAAFAPTTTTTVDDNNGNNNELPSPPDTSIMDFDAMESNPAADGSSAYPPALDLGAWLCQVSSSSVEDIPTLSADEGLVLRSAGFWYHVGHNVARAADVDYEAGGEATHNSWARLLLQMQQDMNCSGDSNSAYAADCVQYYFALMKNSGMLTCLTPEERWAAVMAGLCYHSTRSGGGSTTWRRAERLVDCMCAYEQTKGIRAEDSFFPFTGDSRVYALKRLQDVLSFSEGCGYLELLASCYASPGTVAQPAVQVQQLQLFLSLSKASVFLREDTPSREQQLHDFVPMALPKQQETVATNSDSTEFVVLLRYMDDRVLAPALITASYLLQGKCAETLVLRLRQCRARLYAAAMPDADEQHLLPPDAVDFIWHKWSEAGSASVSGLATNGEGGSVEQEMEMVQLLRENKLYRSHLENILSAVESSNTL